MKQYNILGNTGHVSKALKLATAKNILQTRLKEFFMVSTSYNNLKINIKI